MAETTTDATEYALLESTIRQKDRACTTDQDDPYELEPPPGRKLRRLREDRLAHLFLSGLSVIQEDEKQEAQGICD